MFLYAGGELHAQGTDVIDSLGLRKMLLPLIEITTVDGEMPTCEKVSAPVGSTKSIINATQVPARMVMSVQGDTLYDSGEYETDKSGITIRIRGNTSAYNDKTPFKLRLQRKSDLFFRGREKFKDKNWILLRSTYQQRTAIGLWVNRRLGMEWTPAYTHVNLVINGDYRGVYGLIESVKEGEGRIDIDDTGFIAEYDPYYWTADFYVPGNTYAHLNFTFKYPERADMSDDYVAYVSALLPQMLRSMRQGSYVDIIDVEFFAKWLLGQDILGQGDAYGSNIYLTKYDDTPETKIRMTHLWDFGHCLELPYNVFSGEHTNHAFFFHSMFTSAPYFLDEYVRQWRMLSDSGFAAAVDDCLDSLSHAADRADLCRSLLLDSLRWEGSFNERESVDFDAHIQTAREWFHSHLAWLEDTITALRPPVTFIQPISTGRATRLIYDISGMEHSSLQPGLNVVVEPDGRRRKVWVPRR